MWKYFKNLSAFLCIDKIFIDISYLDKVTEHGDSGLIIIKKKCFLSHWFENRTDWTDL